MNTISGKHTDDLRPVRIQVTQHLTWVYSSDPPPDPPGPGAFVPPPGVLIPPNGRYRHWKGGIYWVVGVAAGPHLVVVYTDSAGLYWLRPIEQWAERFTLVALNQREW